MVDLCAEVVKVVCSLFFLDPANVAADSPLEELGIDSKGRVRLLAALEVHHEVTIDLEQLDRFTDIAAVAEVLAEALNERTGTGRAS
ncbi:acyl carrier protein [Amycolatopsis jiangsuensis]|uniref:Acyl carrier protein n=1 Tax=Amycolatopsis jiangsuensis TaxID=1181879 RepID=A0A840IRI7_9PSEU|nr:acyl carrier protein [Amycolatopsis jiangsuensis]MBB4684149.1 acyl carrier protein [Amycolatopsis jiangsuensis]